MATAALLQALKKLQSAVNAVDIKAVKKPAKRKKNPASRKLGSPSRATGKKPTSRLMARRAKDTVPGYYPNPNEPKTYILSLGEYKSLDTAKKAAQAFADKHGVGLSILTR